MAEWRNGAVSNDLNHNDQKVYNQGALRAYDALVLGGTVPLFWRCALRDLRALYDGSVGTEHLEIGAGSGYFPAHGRFPVPRPRITLVDRNTGPLAYTARRLAPNRPSLVRADVLESLPVPRGAFDSAALNLVLHCLPGTIRDKGSVLRRAAQAVRPGGVVFGSTVLSSGVPMSAPARAVNRALNASGVFHNEHDALDDLRGELDRHFARRSLVVRGCVALFRAHTE